MPDALNQCQPRSDQGEPGNVNGEDDSKPDCLVRLVNVSIGVSMASQDTFGSTKVLAKNVNVNVRKGTNVIITGPSGCGKSSLVKVITSIWKPIFEKFIEIHHYFKQCCTEWQESWALHCPRAVYL